MSKKEEISTALTVIENDTSLTEVQKNTIIAAMNETYGDMMAGIEPRLPKIKIGGSGANVWLVGAEGQPEKSIVAVILAEVKAYAYWHRRDIALNPIFLKDLDPDFNEAIPLCHSMDGINGSRVEENIDLNERMIRCFGRCSACYLNTYGSGVGQDGKPTKGKACKNGRRLLVMPRGAQIPHLLTLPPTSTKAFDEYTVGLRNKGMAWFQVWTTFALDLQSKDGGIKYSVANLSIESPLSPKDQIPVLAFRDQFKTAVKGDITQDEFTGEEQAPVDPNRVPDADENGTPF
ncbi:MAG: hypothetical protein WC455_12380 [Dehalococcoidia bacterium]|jgi:hypothetical protein